MAQNQQQQPISKDNQPNYKQIVENLKNFVNTPTPTNVTDYKQVCQTFVKENDITAIFGSLIVCTESFSIISRGIIKIFLSPLGGELIRNEDVCKWIISGLKQSSNAEYEKLNILSINILYSALQNDKDIEFWIINEKSTLFLWSLSLISSPFETSFQKLEKIIIKHSMNRLLLKTLFSKNIIELLLNIKDQNDNDNVNRTDKGTMNFRAHALWIGALNQYYSNKKTSKKIKGNDDKDNDVEMKGNDDDNDNDGDDEKDDDIMNLYINGGLFKDLLNLLQTDDVLIQINVLPLLSKLSNFEKGLELLLNENIVNILINLLKSDDAILFGKEIYKVLVFMITTTKHIYMKGNNDNIIKWLDDNKLFEIIKLGFTSHDISVQESCCLFIGVFCSFSKILKKLILLKENNDNNNNNVPTNKLYEFVNNLEMNPSAENKGLAIAAIHGLCDILGLKSNENDIYEFQNDLLKGVGGMDKLFEFLKHPNDEMRFSVFRLINNICKQEWGIKLLNECGGLFEYLTNRNDPDIMLGFQWKYTVLETIFKNKNTKNILNQTHKDHLKKYIQRGVVFNDTNKKKMKKKGDNVVQLGWEQY